MRVSIGRVGLLCVLTALPGLAAAEIYQCEENGRKVFSQEPCGANAKAVTLSGGGVSRITIPDVLDERAATDVCKIMVSSWEVAARMSKQRVSYDQAQQRVFGYLRDRIANFDELSKNSPDVFMALKGVAEMLTRDAYANHNIMPGEQNVAVSRCASKTMDSVRANSGSKKTGKSMM